MSSAYDVAIIGGGLAGMTLAAQLQQENEGMSIAVLERSCLPPPDAAHKVGESTVEVGAYYFGKVLGLEDHIREEQLPKLGLRFFFPVTTPTTRPSTIRTSCTGLWVRTSPPYARIASMRRAAIT